MGAFDTIVEIMAEMGVFQLFFPWLLMLSITYGLLEKYQVFSEDPSVNGTIAFAVSFFSIGGAYYFLPEGILTAFAAGLTFSLFGLMGWLLLLGMAGFDISGDELSGDMFSLPAIGALVTFLLSFLGAFAFTADIGAIVGGNGQVFEDIVMPVLVLVFLLSVVAITASD